MEESDFTNIVHSWTDAATNRIKTEKVLILVYMKHHAERRRRMMLVFGLFVALPASKALRSN